MFGSIAGSESLLLSFEEKEIGDTEIPQVCVAMAEAPHGTAPALEGKDIANPMAMILAGAAVLTYIQDPAADRASRAIYESVFETVIEGKTTPDLTGGLSTSNFTDEVIRRVTNKLEVWSALG